MLNRKTIHYNRKKTPGQRLQQSHNIYFYIIIMINMQIRFLENLTSQNFDLATIYQAESSIPESCVVLLL